MSRCFAAVLELQIALSALLERLESFQYAGDPQLAVVGVLRSFETLPLRVRRRS